MRDVRHEKLTRLVQRRASEVILFELKDPRLGFVTVSRVKLSKDVRHAIVYWSIVGSEGDRSKTAHALEGARGFVQTQVARILSTRTTPLIQFVFDEGVEGSVRVGRILSDLRDEREATGSPEEE